MYKVECVLELLHSHDQELTFNRFEIRKQRALAEAEGPQPQPREGTVAVLR